MTEKQEIERLRAINEGYKEACLQNAKEQQAEIERLKALNSRLLAACEGAKTYIDEMIEVTTSPGSLQTMECVSGFLGDAIAETKVGPR